MAQALKNDVVMFFAHGGSVDTCFLESLVGVLSYDAGHQNLIADVRGVEGLYIADNRDMGARRFMRYKLCSTCRSVLSNGDTFDRAAIPHCDVCDRQGSDFAVPEWIWLADTDISFQSYDILDQLIDSTDKVQRPIVSALYFGYMGNSATTVPVWYGRDWDGRIVKLDRFTSGLQRLGVVGMGCCVIHRSVFEKFGNRYAKTGWLYFGHDTAPWTPPADIWNDITPFGEDNCFCHRCNELGIPIHGNGSIVVEHRKKRFENLGTFLQSIKHAKVTENGQEVRNDAEHLSAAK